MSTVAIELNDTGLIVLDESDAPSAAVTSSPGFALLDGDRLVTGVAAWRLARVKPRFIYSRFWEELDTSPLPRPFPRKLTRADLVHAHLGEVWGSIRSHVDKVIFVIPGFYTEEQLGLLLGISRSGGIPVSGLVDSAVAASALGFPGKTLLHIDLHLHRVVATKVRQIDGLQRGRIEWNGKLGLLDLYDAWVKVIAQSFVRETRFDPLHLAETEQVLYKRLPQWLHGLCHQDTLVVSVEASGKTYSIELSREQVVRTAIPLYERVAQLLKSLKSADEPTTVLLSHRLVELPGLEAHLSVNPDIGMTPLSSVAAAAGALARKDQIQSAEGSDELTFVTQLLLGDSQRRDTKPPTVPGVVSGRGDERIPTHVLHEGIAHPISTEPFLLGLAIPEKGRGLNLTGATAGISRTHCRIYRLEDQVFVEDESSYGSFINDKRINGKASVVAGDLLRLGSPGVEVQLIAVMEEHGTPQN
jgi:hypothetical protein